MSIALRVQTHGAGAEAANTIVGDGAIDTRDEAVAALALMPNADDVVIVGTGATATRFTKTQVEAIRDAGATPGGAAPSPDPDEALAAATPGDHTDGYWEVGARGGYSFAFGNYAHSGPNVQIFAGRAFQLGTSWVFLVPQVTLDYRGGNRDYQTPGGEDVNSRFHLLGGGANLLVRLAPPAILQGRLQLDAGIGLAVAGVMTPGNSYEDLPRITGTCPPDVPPVECEPSASRGRANTGATGLLDTRTGASRDAEGGVAVQVRFPFAFQYEIPLGETGPSISPQILVQPGYWSINPHTGTGGGMWDLTLAVGAVGRF